MSVEKAPIPEKTAKGSEQEKELTKEEALEKLMGLMVKLWAWEYDCVRRQNRGLPENKKLKAETPSYGYVEGYEESLVDQGLITEEELQAMHLKARVRAVEIAPSEEELQNMKPEDLEWKGEFI
jgi:hypothetical protein